MSDLTIKRHDTWPPLRATLEQSNPSTGKKEPIDLTSALKVTAILKNQKPGIGEEPTEIVGSVTTPGAGETEFFWTTVPGSTGTSGTFNLEFEIEWSATKIETVPNSGYNTVTVQDDLGTA